MTSVDAAVLTGVKRIAVLKRVVGQPKEGQVQVAINAVGICGSDLAYWAKGVAGGFRELDFSEAGLRSGYCGQMGHECSGTVVAVGRGVSHLDVGDRVALEPGVPSCGGAGVGGACEHCRGGRYNLCTRMRFIGSAVNETPGALTTLFNHSAAFCYKLPDHVSLDEGAMFEPLCVALHAVSRARVKMGDAVLVTGAGPIGLMTALAAFAAGAATVAITDVVDAKLAKAREIGVQIALRADDPAVVDKAVDALAALGGSKFDACFECCGVPSAIDACASAAKSGGVVCVVANHRPSVPAPLQELARREIDLVGVYRYCNLYPTALRLVASGKVDLKPLISKKFPMERIDDAFAYFASGEPVKVLIVPSDPVCQPCTLPKAPP